MGKEERGYGDMMLYAWEGARLSNLVIVGVVLGYYRVRAGLAHWVHGLGEGVEGEARQIPKG